jgi:hypothetical protein
VHNQSLKHSVIEGIAICVFLSNVHGAYEVCLPLMIARDEVLGIKLHQTYDNPMVVSVHTPESHRQVFPFVFLRFWFLICLETGCPDRIFVILLYPNQ